MDSFLGKSKLNFWTKDEDFEQCGADLPSIWRDFSQKAENCEFLLIKKFVKLCLHSSKVVQISLQFDEIFSHGKLRIFTYEKNYEKIRETLFTLRLHSTELLSFWRDFFFMENFKTSKFQFKQFSNEFYLRKNKSWKNSWNFVYIQAT